MKRQQAWLVAMGAGLVLGAVVFSTFSVASTDNFAAFRPALNSPATDAFAVTPDDGNDLAIYPRALLLGTGGTVKVTTLDGTEIALPLVQGFNSIRVARVWSTGTDAAVVTGGIYGLE